MNHRNTGQGCSEEKITPHCFNTQFGQFGVLNTLLLVSTAAASVQNMSELKINEKKSHTKIWQRKARSGLKSQHLLNSSMDKMGATKPKVGSDKIEQISDYFYFFPSE